MVEGQRKYYALSDTCDMSQGEEMSTQMMDGKRCIFIGEGAGVGRNGSDGQFGQGFSITLGLQVAEGVVNLLGKRKYHDAKPMDASSMCLMVASNDLPRDRHARIMRRSACVCFNIPVTEKSDTKFEYELTREVGGLPLATLAYHQWMQALQAAEVTYASSGRTKIGAGVVVTQAPYQAARPSRRTSVLHPRYFSHSQAQVFSRLNAWYFFLRDYPNTPGACMRVLKFGAMQQLRARGREADARIQFADADASSTDANSVLRWFETWYTSTLGGDIPRDFKDPESVRALLGRFRFESVALLKCNGQWFMEGVTRPM